MVFRLQRDKLATCIMTMTVLWMPGVIWSIITNLELYTN